MEREAIVVELPERLVLEQVRPFLNENKPLLSTDRPWLVFDFSRVQEVDSAGIEMLLHCMEHVTRQDGDIKLAAVPSGVSAVLELTCIDRLFEIFEACAEAAESFNTFSVEAAQRSLGMSQLAPKLDSANKSKDLQIAS